METLAIAITSYMPGLHLTSEHSETKYQHLIFTDSCKKFFLLTVDNPVRRELSNAKLG